VVGEDFLPSLKKKTKKRKVSKCYKRTFAKPIIEKSAFFISLSDGFFVGLET